VEDTVHVIARHGSVMATYAMNQHQAANESTTTVICERGTVRAELHKHRWRWVTQPEEPWHDETFEPIERDENFVRQADWFLDCVVGKREPVCTLDEGVQTLKVNLAVLESSDTRRWQSIEK
jgi:predicted dehydrogenase